MKTNIFKQNFEHNITEKFGRHFGEADVSLYHAPARTELGGNHTDHQKGQVLAGAVDLYITAAVTPTKDKSIEIYSEGYGRIKMDITDLSMRNEEVGTTEALIRGVLAGLVDRDYTVGGLKGYISSDVPVGAGLSSSAAFEVLIGKIQSGLYNDDSISYVQLAQACKYAENKYYGKPCGLMDQLACASEKTIYMDFAYDECPIIEEIDYDFSGCGYSLCIINTGGSHENLADLYATVEKEMSIVANIFGQEKLRGITEEQLLGRMDEIRKEAGDRAFLRAVHFANETARARAEADALNNGDFEEFLRIVKESGDSSYKLLQNIYGDNPKNQNLAVALAVSEQILGKNGVCRVHGGGFEGTIQAFVKDEIAEQYKKTMDELLGNGACAIRNLL